ncbi:MAG: hypothetical protein ACKVYV_04570 [Limisphaerales bacterium]
MKNKLALLALASLLGALPSTPARGGLLGPKGDNPEDKRRHILQQRDEMLAELYRSRPELKERLAKAAGYATFSQKDMNLFLLATGNGYGVVRDNAANRDVFMRMASLGGGVGYGVKDVRVVFVFRDPATLRQFVEQGWQFGGQADASAQYKGEGASAGQSVRGAVDYKDGTVAGAASGDARAVAGPATGGTAGIEAGGSIEVYQFTESGISLQATVSGTKYWKDSKLNP